MTKIDDFEGPDHLAWTPPKSGITIKMAKTVTNLGWNKKMDPSHYKQVDFMSNTEFKGKNGQIWPISLFVYYNSSDHWTNFFLYFHGPQVPTINNIQWFFWKEKIYSKELRVFGEKTRWSDKTRSRAAGVVRWEKKTFSRKTR